MTDLDRQPNPTTSLTVPADLAHTALVRACLRDTVAFTTEIDESRFLLALTEVVVNAIEALEQDRDAQIVVSVVGSPPDHVEVRDRGCWCAITPKVGHLGAGLTIADALVPLHVETAAEGTTVRLGLRVGTR